MIAGALKRVLKDRWLSQLEVYEYKRSRAQKKIDMLSRHLCSLEAINFEALWRECERLNINEIAFRFSEAHPNELKGKAQIAGDTYLLEGNLIYGKPGSIRLEWRPARRFPGRPGSYFKAFTISVGKKVVVKNNSLKLVWEGVKEKKEVA